LKFITGQHCLLQATVGSRAEDELRHNDDTAACTPIEASADVDATSGCGCY